MPPIRNNLAAVSTFADIAKDFCQFIEKLNRRKPRTFYTRLENFLSQLHSAILPVKCPLLPDGDTEIDDKQIQMAHGRWKKKAIIFGQILKKETSALSQWHQSLSKDASDCLIKSDMARVEMLWDDLSDIYCDLRSGIVLWDKKDDHCQAEAVWQWRWSYENHWGEHLFDAIKTVHEIRYQLFKD